MQKGETPDEITKREGRFLREVSMLSRVQHKNLVKVCYLYLVPIPLLLEFVFQMAKFYKRLLITSVEGKYHRNC